MEGGAVVGLSISGREMFQLAKTHGLFIVCPILERDEGHGEVVWNTAVVVDSEGQVRVRVFQTSTAIQNYSELL